MHNYHALLQDVLDNGVTVQDRTGTGTRSVFGRQLRFDLDRGFPLVTTKKVFFKGILIELLWLMRGDTNIKFLTDHDVHIWDAWAKEDGSLGEVYGKNWRFWEDTHHISFESSSVEYQDKGYKVVGVSTFNGKSHQVLHRKTDQLKSVIDRIKTNPGCRRLLVSAWNAGRIDQMQLPPCHTLFQFDVKHGRLSCQLYQRSADLFLGVPFNIASYALMTHLIANECGLEVGEFVHSFGDAHIYLNHVDQVKEQLSRSHFPLPSLKVDIPQGTLLDFVDNQVTSLDYVEIQERIKLLNYASHSAIKAPVSV